LHLPQPVYAGRHPSRLSVWPISPTENIVSSLPATVLNPATNTFIRRRQPSNTFLRPPHLLQDGSSSDLEFVRDIPHHRP
jgi:hypothetical protein